MASLDNNKMITMIVELAKLFACVGYYTFELFIPHGNSLNAVKIAVFELTQYDLVTPYGNIDLGLHWHR